MFSERVRTTARASPDVSDDGVLGLLLPKELQQHAAHGGGASPQLLLLQNVQDGQAHGARNRAAPELSQGTKGGSEAQRSGPCSREREAAEGSDRPKPEPRRTPSPWGQTGFSRGPHGLSSRLCWC